MDNENNTGGAYDCLKIENQLCFPLYAASKEVIKRYRPFLDKLELTYTQYLAMMVFWEQKSISVKELGQKLYLDSGTLTPVLKHLEQKEYITRSRSREDERVLVAEITEKGERLRDKAVEVPAQMACCIRLEPQEAAELYRLLYKLLGNFEG
ncbi:MAG: MarR family transcriptional regulator [Ruminococcus sp.]|nr:MarR family transcriptional regulator [Ruminococcus sp.]